MNNLDKWLAFKSAEHIHEPKFSEPEEQPQGRHLRSERGKFTARPPLEDLSYLNSPKEQRAAIAARKGWARMTAEERERRREMNRENGKKMKG